MTENNKTQKKKTEKKYEIGKIVRTVILTALLLGWMVMCSMLQEKYTAEENGEAVVLDEMGNLEKLYVTNISSGNSARCKEEKVVWDYNLNGNCYYLYMPSSANLENLRLGLEGTNHIYLDGERVDFQDKFSLSEGEHLVRTERGEEYPLMVIQSGNLSAMFVNIPEGSLSELHKSKENETQGETLLVGADGEPLYLGEMDSFRVRGNAAAASGMDDGLEEDVINEYMENNKLSYQVKLSKKADLFGMGEAKKWLLISNAEDAALMRNHIAYGMARAAGISYATDTQYVDLYINGDYRGNYLMCEKVEVGENRVEIPDLEKATENVNPGTELSDFEAINPTTAEIVETQPGTAKWFDIPNNPGDITGGYLMELDTAGRYWTSPSGFVTARNQAVVVKNPQYATAAQIEYIRTRYQEFEDAIYSADGVNPGTGLSYTEYCDPDSFAKKYLVEEITSNLDAAITSQNIYKDCDVTDMRFQAGPAWDYDRAFGNFPDIYGFDYSNPEGLTAMQPITAGSVWYGLYQHEEYRQLVISNYNENFLPYLTEQLEGGMDETAAWIEDSAVMDKLRWELHGGKNAEDMRGAFYYHVAEMKKFIDQRTAYLNSQWAY